MIKKKEILKGKKYVRYIKKKNVDVIVQIAANG